MHTPATVRPAVIGSGGSVDGFAALLGDREEGRWRLRPTGDARFITRRYCGDSCWKLMLKLNDGRVTLIDFIPPGGIASHLVRLVRGVQGRVGLLAGEFDSAYDLCAPEHVKPARQRGANRLPA